VAQRGPQRQFSLTAGYRSGPRHSRRMTRSCLDRVTHQEGLGIGPQPLAISGVIIPAEGGLLGQLL
jgi:hypothetical protein